MKRYEVRTTVTGTPRVIDLRVYESTATLRAAAIKWVRTAHRHAPAEFRNTLAVVHGFTRVWVSPDGTETPSELVAIVRFSRGNVTPEIVSHEVAHLAQHIYGLDHIPTGALASDHFDSGNEPFADLTGELFAAIWGVLHPEYP